jgi:ADP-ribosylglycohydrolase
MENAQSNGCLMRASSLACVWNDDVVVSDCIITNPSSLSINVVLLFVNMVRLALSGKSKEDIWNYIMNSEYIKIKEISDAVSDVTKKCSNENDVGWRKMNKGKYDNDENNHPKGWVVNGLYCTLYCLYYSLSFEDSMKWIIKDHPGSDSDTNAAICGSFLGALNGYTALISNEKTKNNISKIRELSTTETGRPEKLSLKNLVKVSEELVKISLL